MKKIIIAAALFIAAFFVLGSYSPNSKEITVNYTVKQGDTMWDIAGKMRDKYGDNRDIREIIHDMRTDNGGSTIYSGQRLTIRLLVPGEGAEK